MQTPGECGPTKLDAHTFGGTRAIARSSIYDVSLPIWLWNKIRKSKGYHGLVVPKYGLLLLYSTIMIWQPPNVRPKVV